MAASRLHASLIASILISIVSIAILPSPVRAQLALPKIVDPAQYQSASGEYTFTVNPSDKYGDGPSECRLTRRGHKIWSRRLSFTPLGVGVTDRGIVGGYGYSWEHDSCLEVVMLDAAGKFRLDDRILRKSIPVVDAPPAPMADDMFMDQAGGRMVVRLVDWDHHKNTGVAFWRQYRLSSGKRLRNFDPASLKIGGEYANISDAQPVPGTPLILLHWTDMDDAVFVLIDSQRRIVWSQRFRNDYVAGEKDDVRYALVDTAKRNGAILPTTSARRFSLWSVAHGVKITYSVMPGSRGSWSVMETGRTRYPVPASPMPHVPDVTLSRLAQFTLTVPGQKKAPEIRGIWAFTFAGSGHIAFLRAPLGDRASLVVTDTAGKVQHVTPLPIGPGINPRGWNSMAWLGGSRYVIGADVEKGSEPAAWFADTATDAVNPVPGFDIPSVKNLAAFMDGRFAVLGTLRARYSISEAVAVYSAQGKRLWRKSNEGGTSDDDPGALMSPDGIAVTSDGDVVIADPVTSSIQYFAGTTGKFLRSVDLKKALKVDMAYTSDVWPDMNGGLLVLNSGTPSPILRIDAAGKIRGSFMPRYRDGRVVDDNVNCVLRSPDGKLWMTDGDMFFGLDETGRADAFLGEPVNTNALREVSEVKVDPSGQIYATDTRSSVMHVFNLKGTWQRSYIPGGTQLRFSLDGNLLTHLKSEKASAVTNSAPIQHRKGSWILKGRYFSDIDLVAADGHILRTVSRQANGKWLGLVGRAVQSPSGSLAVLNWPSPESTETESSISLYDPSGKPIRTIALPKAMGDISSIAYNDRLLVLSAGKVIYGMTPEGHFLWRFNPPTPRDYEGVYFINGGKGIEAWTGDTNIVEYALPG